MSDITVNNPNETPAVVTVQETQSISVTQSLPTNLVVKGIIGGGSDAHYVHTQGSPSAQWSVNHNLNKKPSVVVVSSLDNIVHGDIQYVDNNNVTITFESGAFSGKAYFN